jgi:hypothetical protein
VRFDPWSKFTTAFSPAPNSAIDEPDFTVYQS